MVRQMLFIRVNRGPTRRSAYVVVVKSNMMLRSILCSWLDDEISGVGYRPMSTLPLINLPAWQDLGSRAFSLVLRDPTGWMQRPQCNIVYALLECQLIVCVILNYQPLGTAKFRVPSEIMSFGFSASDFVAAINLIRDVCRALSDAKGARAAAAQEGGILLGQGISTANL